MWQRHTSISHLRMVNFRLFQEADLTLDSRLNVFLGDNGKGKSSVLNAIAAVLSRIFPRCNYLPRLAPIPYRVENIRKWSVPSRSRRGHARQEYAEKSEVACTLGLERVLGEETNKTAVDMAVGVTRNTGLFYTHFHCDALLIKMLNEEVEDFGHIPVFALYGPHRGASQGERKRFSRKKVDRANPFAAYVNALQPSLDFDAFLDWFNEEEASELREQRHDHSYVSKELQCVREALVRVFETSEIQVSNPRFEPNPKRFVMTCCSGKERCVELLFDQLSDGYRGMVALVADFARRLAIANQHPDMNPLDGDGILMIDEVDAHLHPKWQYRVISDLQRTFPNVQLIVTTHSAEVVSMVDRKNVYILNADEDGILQERHPEQQTEGSFPEDIASEVMDAPNLVHVHPAYRAFQECLYLIQAGKEDTPAYAAAYDAVLKHYGENHYFTQEIRSRIEGVKRRRELLDRLHKEKQ